MDEKSIFKALLDASNCPNESILPSLLKAVANILHPKMCSLWKVNTISDPQTVSIYARENYSPDSTKIQEFTHPVKGSLIGHVIETTEAEKKIYLDIPDIRQEPYRTLHKGKERINKLSLKRFISIPIPDYDAQPLGMTIDAVFNIYPDDDLVFSEVLANLIRDQFSLAISRARLISREDLTRQIMGQYEKRGAKDLPSVLYPIITEDLRKYFRYEGCSVFMWDPFYNRLSLAQTTGLVGKPRKSDVYYYLGEGLTGKMAETRELMVLSDLAAIEDREIKRQYIHKWQEDTKHPGKSFLGIPIKSPSRADELIGVIRFTNKLNPLGDVVDQFNRDDIALVGHACNLLALYIENEQNERVRASFAGAMAHEILTPAVSIRATANRLLRKWDSGVLSKRYINRDLDDIQNYAELQIALTNTVRFLGQRFSKGPKITKYQIAKFNLLKDVLIASKKLVIPIAREEGVTYDNIVIKGEFPDLYIDKYAFRQIFFNLLTNSIKYRTPEVPQDFNTIIECHGYGKYSLPKKVIAESIETPSGQTYPASMEGYLIRIEDVGIGIDPDEVDKIFLLGYRKKGIEKRNVRGLGVGLRVVKDILGDFNCKVWVANLKNPTRFNVFLPVYLEDNKYLESEDWRSG